MQRTTAKCQQCPTTRDTSTIQVPPTHPDAQGTLQKKVGGNKSQRRKEVWGQVVPPRNVREASLVIAQHHGCLSKTGPMVTPMDMPVWRGFTGPQA